MPLSCIIVDDEPLAVKLLESFVTKTPDLTLLASFTDSVEAINAVKEQRPNLLFLDIQMPDLNGMELAHMIPSETRVIFTTAFKEYAFESYEVKALDFLLKPIRYNKFLAAVDKAKEWYSRSDRVNQYMLRYIYRFAQPSLYKMELVKALPSNITFDMDAYEKQYLDDVLENGRPRYTEAQKEEVRQSICEMIELIHKKDYFTIAKDVKKSRYRPYMMHFLKFANKEDEELCASIRKQNVLIIDDVATSGSTLGVILRTLRIMNEDNDITIFSLMGRKDLMADAG